MLEQLPALFFALILGTFVLIALCGVAWLGVEIGDRIIRAFRKGPPPMPVIYAVKRHPEFLPLAVLDHRFAESVRTMPYSRAALQIPEMTHTHNGTTIFQQPRRCDTCGKPRRIFTAPDRCMWCSQIADLTN